MLPLNEYDKQSIVSRELIEEIFEEPDEIERSYMIADISLRAKELGVISIFKKLVSERVRVEREVMKAANSTNDNQRVTDFSIPIEKSYENMKCGSWVANNNGIVSYNVMGLEQRACHHPILPIKRLSNIETNEEKITLAFRRDYSWKEITVDKDIISSASKIVALSKYGISVTSENSKHLVKYLNDVENLNNEVIELDVSTSRLGWHDKDFIPYDNNIVFDGDTRFKQIFDSIKEHGHEDKWLDHVRELRKRDRMEIKFILASSFASVLIKPLGILPFFVDLWGETEGGKSVSLMLAASVWANPDESQYIGDYKSTDVALEVRADMLNNLPVLLDDTSNATQKIVQDFENIIYRLCSGKGKSRSNKELGFSRENHWKTCFITNGERPLSGYVTQGGAINRILEIECGSNIYENPSLTADTLKANYGFAGKRFIEEIKDIGIDNLKSAYKKVCDELMSDKKMAKQTMSLACVLLADKIATERIFKDECYISIEDAKKCLVDRIELSENERCYEYLLGKIAGNSFRFDPEIKNIEKWGSIEENYAIIYNPVFVNLCSEEGFSKKSFLSWAAKNDKIKTFDGNTTKVKRKVGVGEAGTARCVWLKLSDDDGFLEVDETEKLPFN